MNDRSALADLLARLEKLPRASLALLPTPIQPLNNFATSLGGPALWMKRDDLSGLEGGGNKTRKLEFLVGDALRQGADMLVTVGAIHCRAGTGYKNGRYKGAILYLVARARYVHWQRPQSPLRHSRFRCLRPGARCPPL
jgi:hypothetical protein